MSPYYDGPLNIRTFVGNGKGWKFRGLPFERAIRSGRNTPLLYSSIKSGKNWSFVSLGVFLGGSFCQEILRGNSYTSWIWFRELKRIEYFWKEDHEFYRFRWRVKLVVNRSESGYFGNWIKIWNSMRIFAISYLSVPSWLRLLDTENLFWWSSLINGMLPNLVQGIHSHDDLVKNIEPDSIW